MIFRNGNSFRASRLKKKWVKCNKRENYYNIVAHEQKMREKRNKAYLEHFTRLYEERQRERGE